MRPRMMLNRNSSDEREIESEEKCKKHGKDFDTRVAPFS